MQTGPTPAHHSTVSRGRENNSVDVIIQVIMPPECYPSSRNGLYLRHYPFYAGSVALIFKIRTGEISSQYHMVFGDILSTVEHTSKGAVSGNWKNLVEEHSYITKQ